MGSDAPSLLLWRLCLVCLSLLDWHLEKIVFLAEIM